jgi:hypothetical protein
MYLNIETVNIFDRELTNDNQQFKTNINISNIEDYINTILDKHSELCKYYININENYWSVSFNVGMNQLEALCKSTFEINLYKDINNNSIIIISNEINEFEQWSEVYRDLIKKLKK